MTIKGLLLRFAILDIGLVIATVRQPSFDGPGGLSWPAFLFAAIVT